MSLAQAAGRRMLVSSARGGIRALALSSAHGGGIGALSSVRGSGFGAPSSARGGGIGAFPPSLTSGRRFSSSSWFEPGSWEKYKPSEGTQILCAVLSGFTGVCYCVGAGYDLLISKATERTTSYVDSKLVEFKGFQNLATGTHHEFVGKFNEAMHAKDKEIADLNSRILALEQKAFDQRKELLIAAELLLKHQAAAAAADGEK